MPIHVRSFSQIFTDSSRKQLAHAHSHLADFDPAGGSSTFASVGRISHSWDIRCPLSSSFSNEQTVCEIHVLHVFYRGPETLAYRLKSPGLIT